MAFIRELNFMRNRILFMVVCLAFIAGIIFFVVEIHSEKILPIQSVSIYGVLQPEDKPTIQSLISSDVQTSLLSVKLRKIQFAIQQFPWVQNVNVKRVWPNQLSVVILNQEPVAWWNDQWLINVYGEKFQKGSLVVSNDLPKFYGNGDSIIKMLAYYQQINTMFIPLNLTVNQLELDQIGSWQITLSNGMILKVSQDDALMRIQRFVRIYKNVFQDNKSAKIVDLRYSHGFAVKW